MPTNLFTFIRECDIIIYVGNHSNWVLVFEYTYVLAP